MRLKFGKPDPAGSKAKKTDNASVEVSATAKCGHLVVSTCLAKHAATAAQHLTLKDCKPCRALRVEAEKQAAIERKRSGAKHPRLPHGSAFAATYDAENVRWTGTLTIEEQTFEASARGVFPLMAKLDAQYRRKLRTPSEQ